jgi:hypothetical protein
VNRDASRLVSASIAGIDLDPVRATVIYRRPGNLRAVQIQTTVRYLEVDSAFAIAEQVGVRSTGPTLPICLGPSHAMKRTSAPHRWREWADSSLCVSQISAEPGLLDAPDSAGPRARSISQVNPSTA